MHGSYCSSGLDIVTCGVANVTSVYSGPQDRQLSSLEKQTLTLLPSTKLTDR